MADGADGRLTIVAEEVATRQFRVRTDTRDELSVHIWRLLIPGEKKTVTLIGFNDSFAWHMKWELD